MIQVSSNDVIVMDESGESISCKLAGRFRLYHKQNSNLIRVGDFVHIKKDDQASFVIDTVEDRYSKFSRLKPHSKNDEQIIAANIDQILIFVSFVDPMFKTGFIDRFLAVAEYSKLRTLLCFNKLDLTKLKVFAPIVDYYKQITDKLLITSVPKKKGIKDVKHELKNASTVVTGPSGVGKSSLINVIDPSLHIRTSEVSDYSHKGLHTTTVSHFYVLNSIKANIIDTPGLREFGLFGIEKEELKNYFRDFLPYAEECKFHNCLHLNEPNCAVKKAIDEENIADFRYESYLSMYEELDDREKKFYK